MEAKSRKMALASNILYGLVITLVISQLILRWIENGKKEGIELPSHSYTALNLQKNIQFPRPDENTLMIFWATWCTPCKVEMNRLKASVESGKIRAEQIFAINPFESETIVKNFLHKEHYPFTFISDENITRVLVVSATPTTVLMNGTKVHSVSTGLSLFGIWRAEFFLNKD